MDELVVIEKALNEAVDELHRLFTRHALTPAQWRAVCELFSRPPNRFLLWEVLNKAGATFRKPDRASSGILWWAATSGQWDLIPRLVELGADINEVSHDDPQGLGIPETVADHAVDLIHSAVSDAQAEAREALWEQIRKLGGK